MGKLHEKKIRKYYDLVWWWHRDRVWFLIPNIYVWGWKEKAFGIGFNFLKFTIHIQNRKVYRTQP